MSRPTLLHIETVLCVSRIGSFSGAARKLNATQPAISARVRDLESSLGYKIFARQGQRMALTAKGREFLEELEPIFNRLQNILNEHDVPTSATIRLGCGPIAMSALVSEVIGDMQKNNSSLRFQITIGISNSIIPLLDQDKLDIVIVPGRIDYPGFKLEKLGSRLDGVWAAADDRWNRYSGYAKDFNIENFINSGPIWIPPVTSKLYQEQVDILRGFGANMKNINHCDDSRIIGDLILASGGLGYVQRALVREKLISGRLVEINELPMVRDSDYYFLWKDSNLSPIVKTLIRLAQSRNNNSKNNS